MSHKNYITPSFTENVKKWIDFDNQIQQLNYSLKTLRKHKNEIGKLITVHIEQNDLIKTKITMKDGYIKYSKTSQTPSLTIKYIHQCLKEYLHDEDLANTICEYIKENRKRVPVVSIKRHMKQG
tara:strand:+ start:105 stop:476 length:372 start_codon:yes stop_codon:yes gene_type:complete